MVAVFQKGQRHMVGSRSFVDAVEVEAVVDTAGLARVVSERLGGLNAADVCGAHGGLEVRLSRELLALLFVAGSGILLVDVVAHVDVAHEWVVGIVRSPSFVMSHYWSVTSWIQDVCSSLPCGRKG